MYPTETLSAASSLEEIVLKPDITVRPYISDGNLCLGDLALRDWPAIVNGLSQSEPERNTSQTDDAPRRQWPHNLPKMVAKQLVSGVTGFSYDRENEVLTLGLEDVSHAGAVAQWAGELLKDVYRRRAVSEERLRTR